MLRRHATLALGLLLYSGGALAQTISYTYSSVQPFHAPKRDTHWQQLYNANGDLTCRKPFNGTSSCDNGGTQFFYNNLNKLSRVEQGATSLRYLYDANGTRVAKLVGGVVSEKYFGAIDIKNGSSTRYYFLGAKRVAERDPSGQIYFYHQDHLGSTSLVTNASGAVVRRTGYYEYGAVKSEATAGKSVDYTYNDKRTDPQTELNDYGARDYAAKFMQFTSADTIVPDPADPQSFNRYAYVKNNPLKFIDPTGHAPEWVNVIGDAWKNTVEDISDGIDSVLGAMVYREATALATARAIPDAIIGGGRLNPIVDNYGSMHITVGHLRGIG